MTPSSDGPGAAHGAASAGPGAAHGAASVAPGAARGAAPTGDARSTTWTAAYLIFVSLVASSGPSSIYPVYAHDYHLSTFVLTEVYAVYAVGVLGSLLFAGRVSDRIGRKPVLVAATVMTLIGAAVFGAAQSPTWLFAARLLQGVGVGNIGSAATAALVDLSVGRPRFNPSLVSTLAYTTGAGLGVMVFALCAQYLPWPTRTPFLVVGAACLVGLALALRLPAGLGVTPASRGRPMLGELRASLRLQKPSIPRAVARPAVAAFLTAAAAWPVAGLYASLAPSMVVQLLHQENHVVSGVALFVYFGLSGLGQLLGRTRPPRVAMLLGLTGTAAGIAVLELAVQLSSIGVFVAGTMLVGIGFGAGYLGSLALVNELAPPDRRAELVAAYNVVGYTALSIPVLGVGLLAGSVGLRTASGIFTLVVVAVSVPSVLVVHRLRVPVVPAPAPSRAIAGGAVLGADGGPRGPSA